MIKALRKWASRKLRESAEVLDSVGCADAAVGEDFDDFGGMDNPLTEDSLEMLAPEEELPRTERKMPEEPLAGSLQARFANAKPRRGRR